MAQQKNEKKRDFAIDCLRGWDEQLANAVRYSHDHYDQYGVSNGYPLDAARAINDKKISSIAWLQIVEQLCTGHKNRDLLPEACSHILLDERRKMSMMTTYPTYGGVGQYISNLSYTPWFNDDDMMRLFGDDWNKG